MSRNDHPPAESGGDLSLSLFERYCAGDAMPHERAAIEAWMVAHPEEQAWYERVRAGMVAGAFGGVSESDIERHLAAVLRRIRVQPSRSQIPNRSREVAAKGGQWRLGRIRTGRWALWTSLSVAAVAVLAWYGSTVRLAPARGRPMLTYTTGNGQRANITLPDGSTVALDVASRLEVPADYLAGNHTVRLKGEAIFTVTHHDGAPFSVVAGGVATQVLGTNFLVRHYAGDTTTVVSVHDGKVSVHPGRDERMTTRGQDDRAASGVVLTAAQQVIVGANQLPRIETADASRFSFASGVLTLTGGLFVNAIPELNRWYNADIRVQDPALATRRLTAEYPAGSLTDLATILEETFGVRVVRDGRVLTLYSR